MEKQWNVSRETTINKKTLELREILLYTISYIIYYKKGENMVKQKWVTVKADEEIADKLSKETGIEKSITRILVSRGIDTPLKTELFLKPEMKNLSDPFLLKDMDKAVLRIKKAIENKEKIAVYGDYDVDGITGVTVLMMYLSYLNADVFYYIPDRLKDGYGLNSEAIDYLKSKNADLIITVDCGITAVNEVLQAKECGMDVVVTDHHKCPEILPQCEAVINPKREDNEFPFSELAGVGVAFMLILALSGGELPSGIMNEILSLTALGTVADIVPLIEENRIIVKNGIDIIKEGKCRGINALLNAAEMDKKAVTSTILSFQIAPRINASGRMGSAKDAVEMFISKDDDKIKEIASLLNNQNILRQTVEKSIYDEVSEKIRTNKEYKNEDILVLGKEGWHSGVIGIVASKLTDEFYKPSIMITFEDGIGKGSLRSIKGFNIYEALKSVSHLLVKFGGHELAAGLTIEQDKFEEFKAEITRYAKEKMNGNIVRELSIDSEINENEMTVEFADKVSMLEPFGMANPQPVFVVKNAKVVKSTDFKEGKHLRLMVKKKNTFLNAIGFSLGKYASSLKKDEEIYIAGTANINDYRGEKSFQIRIKDIRLA